MWPFWLTLQQPCNLNLVKYLKLFLEQAFSMIWSSRVKLFTTKITVRAGEDKSNRNNLSEIAKIAIVEKNGFQIDDFQHTMK
jgi:hypothetical protein